MPDPMNLNDVIVYGRAVIDGQSVVGRLTPDQLQHVERIDVIVPVSRVPLEEEARLHEAFRDAA